MRQQALTTGAEFALTGTIPVIQPAKWGDAGQPVVGEYQDAWGRYDDG